MDEPTTGLHMSDISHLLAIMDRLVDMGNTVIVIEHNLDIIKNADWIIDMGPEGGNKGGRVMFEGTPLQLLNTPQSLTSAYLRN
jgi:excinuclease UvrABC ATPase subunit